MSAIRPAAVGSGDPAVFDPLPGFPTHPFFKRDRKYFTDSDNCGRPRLATVRIYSLEKD